MGKLIGVGKENDEENKENLVHRLASRPRVHATEREAAKKRGVRFGRPRKLALDQGDLARRLVSEGKSVRDIASLFNVHPATIYRLAAT